MPKVLIVPLVGKSNNYLLFFVDDLLFLFLHFDLIINIS